MRDVAMRRIAALVIAALLAISGAALTISFFAADYQAAVNTGNFVNSGDLGIAYDGYSGGADTEIYT